MISGGLEAFLDYIRRTREIYRMSLSDEQETNDATRDILHALEPEEHDAEGYARLAEKLRQVRQARQLAKDSISQALPVVEWAEAGKEVL